MLEKQLFRHLRTPVTVTATVYIYSIPYKELPTQHIARNSVYAAANIEPPALQCPDACLRVATYIGS